MLLIDDSLSIINRTGAHFIAKELVAEFGTHACIRRWRFLDKPLQEGIPRKVAARLMIRELSWLTTSTTLPWPEPKNITKRLFLDPLYVLRSRMTSSDIVLCHDIGPITHPDLYDHNTVRMYKVAYDRIQSIAPRMIFVSETSRREFERHYGHHFPQLHAIPLFVRPATTEGESESIPGIGPRYFLTVGALERRKNHTTTIEAFRQSGLADQGVQLVVCGSRGDATAAVTELARRTPGVVMPGYVTDAQLRWLYRNAIAFVLPSLLEGFGMPALEAAQYGLHCIVSRDSALNEAIGGLGTLTNENSPEEIQIHMREIALAKANNCTTGNSEISTFAKSQTRDIFIENWKNTVQQ